MCVCGGCVHVCVSGVSTCVCFCIYGCVYPISSGSIKALLVLPGIQHESSVSVVRVVLNVNVRVS